MQNISDEGGVAHVCISIKRRNSSSCCLYSIPMSKVQHVVLLQSCTAWLPQACCLCMLCSLLPLTDWSTREHEESKFEFVRLVSSVETEIRIFNWVSASRVLRTTRHRGAPNTASSSMPNFAATCHPSPIQFFGAHTYPEKPICCTRHWWIRHVTAVRFNLSSKQKTPSER